MAKSNIPDDIDLRTVPLVERESVKWILHENIENHPFLKPCSIVPLNEKDYFRSFDFRDDINFYLDLLKKQNLDALMAEMTLPNIPLSTVKVIIPSLRHFWSRLGPGRLYDVPVAMKWLKFPKHEEQMNPVPYFT